MRVIAKRHLSDKLSIPFNDAILDVNYFAEEAYNILYRILYIGGYDTNYLLGMPVPTIPYYRTGSEIVKIAYLRANTSIPLPQILAWDSQQGNELGFEWILIPSVVDLEDGGKVGQVDRWVYMKLRKHFDEAIGSH